MNKSPRPQSRIPLAAWPWLPLPAPEAGAGSSVDKRVVPEQNGKHSHPFIPTASASSDSTSYGSKIIQNNSSELNVYSLSLVISPKPGSTTTAPVAFMLC